MSKTNPKSVLISFVSHASSLEAQLGEVSWKLPEDAAIQDLIPGKIAKDVMNEDSWVAVWFDCLLIFGIEAKEERARKAERVRRKMH